MPAGDVATLDVDSARANTARELTDRLRSILDERELRVLAAHLFDGRTQTEIAEDEGRPQTTVGYWLRRAVSKLAAAGIDLPAVRPADRLVYCDPEAMDKLSIHLEAEQRCGRWIAGPKTSRRAG